MSASNADAEVRGDFLKQMADRSRERVAAARKVRSEAAVVDAALAMPHPPTIRSSGGGFDLIAEIKLRSPAAGALKPSDEGIEARAVAYASAGAAAVSVLTEPSRFDGSMTHLEAAARALKPTRVPAMRKDFLIDTYQVAEARAAGAGGVLLILRMLNRGELEALLHAARRFKVFALLEAFDEADIELSHQLLSVHGGEGVLVGVNCRDLVTLQVVPGRLEQLASLLPSSVPRVAESGVGTPDDARSASQAGYDFALVGSALMQASDPAALARSMLEAGRKK
jgi:indole-3-glycerol phosphate synthase